MKLVDKFIAVRNKTVSLTEPLTVEDMIVQVGSAEKAEVISITFNNGLPVKLNGKAMLLADLNPISVRAALNRFKRKGNGETGKIKADDLLKKSKISSTEYLPPYGISIFLILAYSISSSLFMFISLTGAITDRFSFKAFTFLQ